MIPDCQTEYVYAIIDIETTGGAFNQEGITEIAIYRFDGTEITDQLISLVNPERPIQPFVEKLTGIKQPMLKAAPKFYEIAKRIIEIIDGCIIVAHNANFDYRVLQLEFNRLGYNFNMPTLCTVELSKKLLPDASSYSLGKLVRSLGIPIADRHRASGDALATVKLFELLLAKDEDKTIVKNHIKNELSLGISPKWISITEKLPYSTGIVYFYNQNQQLIYVIKATNIYKKALTILTGEQRIYQKIQQEVFDISFETTGSEIIAKIKEDIEIKKHKPKYNNTQNLYIESKWAVFFGNDEQPLKVGKTDSSQPIIRTFKKQKSAQKFIEETLREAQEKSDSESISLALSVKQIITEKIPAINNSILVLKGRKNGEKGIIMVENNTVKGYGYAGLNYQISEHKILKQIIIPVPESKNYYEWLIDYLCKKNNYKIIPLQQPDNEKIKV